MKPRLKLCLKIEKHGSIFKFAFDFCYQIVKIFLYGPFNTFGMKSFIKEVFIFMYLLGKNIEDFLYYDKGTLGFKVGPLLTIFSMTFVELSNFLTIMLYWIFSSSRVHSGLCLLLTILCLYKILPSSSLQNSK